MTTNFKSTAGMIAPILRYRDVAAAIDWLCMAFGFERHQIVTAESGGVSYAQLAFGDGMVIICPVEDAAVDGLMAQPEENGGFETQICYLFVTDVMAHCATARAAGAEIMLDLEDEGGCSKGYSCRDPEGHIWNFGSYDPRQTRALRRQDGKSRAGLRTAVNLAPALITAIGVLIVPLDWPRSAAEHMLAMASTGRGTFSHAVADGETSLAADGRSAVRALGEAREQLVRERSARALAELAAKEATKQLSQERNARVTSQPTIEEARKTIATAERTVVETRQRLSEAERDAEQARQRAVQERTAREAMERMVTQVREQLAAERAARGTAEVALKQAREHAERAVRDRYYWRRIAHHAHPVTVSTTSPPFGQW
jgi:uncharacterized glyoxalase superfamily protein PhnB